MAPTNTGTPGHLHAIKFYRTADTLCYSVAAFLGDGLNEQQPVLVIATPAIRVGIVRALRRRYIDVDSAEAAGDLLFLDVTQTLAEFMVGDRPDAGRFARTATRAVDTLLRGRPDAPIRAYGGMVCELWRSGRKPAAIRLEALWNTLAVSRKFSMLCGYALGPVYQAEEVAGLVEQHSHVLVDSHAVQLARGSDCPACGAPLPDGADSPPVDRAYRCACCSVTLINHQSAQELTAREHLADLL